MIVWEIRLLNWVGNRTENQLKFELQFHQFSSHPHLYFRGLRALVLIKNRKRKCSFWKCSKWAETRGISKSDACRGVRLTPRSCPFTAGSLTKVNTLQGRRHHLQRMYFPEYQEDLKICPFTTLCAYIDKLHSLAPADEDHLFLITQTPFSAAALATLAQWARQLLVEAGVPNSGLKLHSTRAANTSTSYTMGEKLESMLSRIGWTRQSTFYNHYCKPLHDLSSLPFQTNVTEDTSPPSWEPPPPKDTHVSSDYFSRCDSTKIPTYVEPLELAYCDSPTTSGQEDTSAPPSPQKVSKVGPDTTPNMVVKSSSNAGNEPMVGHQPLQDQTNSMYSDIVRKDLHIVQVTSIAPHQGTLPAPENLDLFKPKKQAFINMPAWDKPFLLELTSCHYTHVITHRPAVPPCYARSTSVPPTMTTVKHHIPIAWLPPTITPMTFSDTTTIHAMIQFTKGRLRKVKPSPLKIIQANQGDLKDSWQMMVVNVSNADNQPLPHVQKLYVSAKTLYYLFKAQQIMYYKLCLDYMHIKSYMELLLMTYLSKNRIMQIHPLNEDAYQTQGMLHLIKIKDYAYLRVPMGTVT